MLFEIPKERLKNDQMIRIRFFVAISKELGNIFMGNEFFVHLGHKKLGNWERPAVQMTPLDEK